MVQIIRLVLSAPEPTTVAFISHMVQIIPTSTVTFTLPAAEAFISHMVQIIHNRTQELELRIRIFISHMVQIILSFKVQAISTETTLYPTWFR